MEFATNSIGIVSLSPEQAAEYTRHNYDHNRGLRLNRVEYLANEMRNGRFMPTAEVHIMYRNGEPVLVNGQHTCAAIVKYGKPIRVTLRKTIATEAGQVAMMYAFGHDTGLGRTFNDSMRAYDISDATGLTTTQINALAASLKFIRYGFSSTGTYGAVKISPADLVNDAYNWANDVKLLITSTVNKDGLLSRLILKRPILSVAMITLYYQTDKAIDFWSKVVDPDRLATNDIRISTRKRIIDSVHDNSHKDIAGLARACARGWSVFYNNEPVSRIQISEPLAPIVIAGTPYNGKQPKDFLPSKHGVTIPIIA